MELRHLRYFIRTAELLHFTRAAESLFISQPTLSSHIQQLEEELGAELFARIGRRVQLTEAGEIFLKHAKTAVSEVELAAAEIEATTGLLRGHLTVAALPAHSSKLLPGWLTAFNTIHPEVHVSARTGTHDDIEAGLISGDISIAFSYVPPQHSEISGIELLTDEVVAVMHKSHRLANQAQLTIDDLRGLPVALSSHRTAILAYMHKYFAEIKAEPKVVVEYDDGLALIELIKLSGLVTMLPRSAVKNDPEIRAIELPPPGVQISLGILATHLSPAASAFLDVVKESVKYIKQSALHAEAR
jgi:LysR family cyn operon transcriptional activator